MPTLLSHLSNILDIPVSFSDIIVNESRNKLVGTYMIVNKKLYHVTRFDHNALECYDARDGFNFSGGDIYSLEYYLPESGCYFIGGTYKYLQKISKRQWKKSFSWSYYTLSNRTGETDVFRLFEQSPVSMYMIDNYVFYRTLHLATKDKKGKFTLHVPSMKYELDNFLKRKEE